MLPKDWKRVPLHTVAEVRTGLAKGKQGLLDPVELPYLRVANVQDGHFDLGEIKTILVERSAIERYTLRSGDVLMTEGGDFDKLGRGAVWKAPVTPCLHQNHVFSVRPQRGILDSTFLAALSSSRYGRTYFEGCAKRSTNLASINSSQLKEFPVILPPHREQLEIAGVLDTWDAAVKTVEKLLANSRKQKEALMEQLIGGKRRLYGYATERRTYRLGELFHERVETNRCDLPLLSVTRDEGVIPRDAVGRKDTSNEDKSKYLRVCPGDIAYNTMRMWQGVSALSRLEGIVSPAYTVVIPNKLIDARFAAHLFKYPPVVFLFYRYSQGLVSDTWNLKFPHFSEIKVEIPLLSEQIAIAKMLNDADAEIMALEKEVNFLREEKRTIMADLLTGKRRVRLPIATVDSQAA